MKKAWKALAVLLTIAVFSLMVIGSGSAGSGSATAAVLEEKTAGAKEQTETTAKADETKTKAAEETAIDFPAAVIVDNDQIYFEIKSIEWDKIWGYTLRCICENRTDKDLMFTSRYAYVNGWECDLAWISTINAGKKSNESLSFSKERLKECGITDVTNITFNLRAYDSNDWTAEPVEDNEYTVYPLGEDADKEYERVPQDSDEVLADNDDLAIVVVGKRIDSIWGYTLDVYLENKSEKPLMYSVLDATVNGFMCDPLFAKSIMPGKKAMGSISWGKITLEKQGLTPEDVEEVELPFKVYNEDNFLEDPVLEETFTVKAK